MDWTQQIDIYCERLGPGLWAEPLNLVSNLAFIFGALYAWPRVRHDLGARVLCVALFAIGICSALFHSFAERWAETADVASIAIFVLIYLFIAARRFARWPGPVGMIGILLFVIYMILVPPLLKDITGPLNGSLAYVSICLAIVLLAMLASLRFGVAARGLLAGAIILAISIGFRSVDMEVCAVWPHGTHFMWHTLNGMLLTGLTLVIARVPRY